MVGVNQLDFYFVGLRMHRYPIIIDPTNKLRYACFKTEESAKDCVEYLANFRSKNGNWPQLDLYRTSLIERNFNAKKRTPEEIKKYMTINRKEFGDLYISGANSGVSYFYIHNFEYEEDFTKVYIQGQAIDGSPDLIMFRKRLDYRLKIV